MSKQTKYNIAVLKKELTNLQNLVPSLNEILAKIDPVFGPLEQQLKGKAKNMIVAAKENKLKQQIINCRRLLNQEIIAALKTTIDSYEQAQQKIDAEWKKSIK
jgi:uncharacterized protein YukE